MCSSWWSSCHVIQYNGVHTVHKIKCTTFRKLIQHNNILAVDDSSTPAYCVFNSPELYVTASLFLSLLLPTLFFIVSYSNIILIGRMVWNIFITWNHTTVFNFDDFPHFSLFDFRFSFLNWWSSLSSQTKQFHTSTVLKQFKQFLDIKNFKNMIQCNSWTYFLVNCSILGFSNSESFYLFLNREIYFHFTLPPLKIWHSCTC